MYERDAVVRQDIAGETALNKLEPPIGVVASSKGRASNVDVPLVESAHHALCAEAGGDCAATVFVGDGELGL